MYRYEFTTSALKDIKKLDGKIQKRILAKLDFFISSAQPLIFARRMIDRDFGQYRFRVGDYRILFDVYQTTFTILAIDHRSNIYRW